ncbi:hypothetical protein Dvina_23645 [Dactylosporangium vinaceum]|uniref:Uncharacterized protein n=1 Tax=Dactylosporangium vinaceum TaxID=53362 RepID=A0ABV5MCZ2_9ACTN|nr:hypothetical protein [Dactylosporangium vinaceum]UAC00779.1 hypothetical protein Dvina_23645 [Dactylosporangium vinaceum]
MVVDRGGLRGLWCAFVLVAGWWCGVVAALATPAAASTPPITAAPVRPMTVTRRMVDYLAYLLYIRFGDSDSV